MSREQFFLEHSSPTEVIICGPSEYDVRSKIHAMPGLISTGESCIRIHNGMPCHGIKVRNTCGMSKLQIEHMLKR